MSASARHTINESPITDAQIEFAFRGTNFGPRDHRKLLEQGVLKTWAGYSSGSTLTAIMRDLGLLTRKGEVSALGRKFAFAAFYQERHSG